jgi:class 3 adenylate cyclase
MTMYSEDEIEAIVSENKYLNNKLRLLEGGFGGGSMFSVAPRRTDTKSIAGLKEAYLVFDSSLNIVQINSKMCDLLGAAKDDTLRQKTITDIDTLPWAPNVFTTLIQESKNTGQEIEFEIDRESFGTGKQWYIFRMMTSGSGGGTVVVEDVSEKKSIMESFGRYVSPAVIKKMQEMEEDFFKTDRYVMTVLFADLRGFTKVSSKLSPEEVKNMVNEFLTAAIDVIDEHGATLDKIVGDEVMALFGAPLRYQDHSLRALKVAIDMQKAHRRVRDRWQARSIQAPPLGIGINSGEMVVGNIGCNTRVDYTVLGHNVNLAARLCSHAAGGEILVSMQTVEQVKKFLASHPNVSPPPLNFKKAGEIKVKGIDTPLPVVKLLYQE